MNQIAKWFNKLHEWLWSLLPDNCEVCRGGKGGIRGNENIVDGVVMCDYCHSWWDDLCKKSFERFVEESEDDDSV